MNWEENKRQYFYFACIIVILIAIVAGAHFFTFSNLASKTSSIPKTVTVNGILIPTSSQIQNSVFSTSSAQHLVFLSNQLTQATSENQKALIERQIATISSAGDPALGYQQLQAVAANTSFSSQERALAVQTIGDTYFNRSGQDPTNTSQWIFNVPPYNSMLGSSSEAPDAQMWDGMKNLYTYAISLSDSPISEYRVALWYLNDAETTSGTQKNNDLASAQQSLDKGNAILDQFISQLANQDGYMGGDAYWLQALVTSTLGNMTNDSSLSTEAKGMYDKARAQITNSELDGFFKVELLWADLNYAIYLEQQPASQDNTNLTNQLLEEIVQTNKPEYGFSRWLTYLNSAPLSVQSLKDYKEEITTLSAQNSDFAHMLQNLGWKV